MKHFNAIITTQCFLVGSPMPPKGARKMVYVMSKLFNSLGFYNE